MKRTPSHWFSNVIDEITVYAAASACNFTDVIGIRYFFGSILYIYFFFGYNCIISIVTENRRFQNTVTGGRNESCKLSTVQPAFPITFSVHYFVDSRFTVVADRHHITDDKHHNCNVVIPLEHFQTFKRVYRKCFLKFGSMSIHFFPVPFLHCTVLTL